MASMFSDKRVLFYDGMDVLSYRKGRLYFNRDTSIVQSVRIGDNRCLSVFVSRLLRLEPRCCVKVNQNCFLVSWNGCIINYSPDNNTYIIEHTYDRGMKNPLSFLPIDNTASGEKEIYFGEYIWNGEKGPVGIYKRSKESWRKVYEFPAGIITHIHNIIFDEFRSRLIILTGDEDKESGIWTADLCFQNVEPLLVGSQQYRACVAFPTVDGIYYATDTPLEDNYIYFLPFDQNQAKRKPEKIYELPGPCIYGTQFKGRMVFATSVEPNPELPTWKYRTTSELGRGVHTRESCIIVGESGGVFSISARFKKDAMPMWLFQFGNVVFPTNESDLLLGVLQSLNPRHGITVRIEVE